MEVPSKEVLVLKLRYEGEEGVAEEGPPLSG